MDGAVLLLRGAPDESRLAVLRLAASVLLAGETVYWVEGANRFDLYALTESATRWGIDPHFLLRRIKIARAFTVHQLETIVARDLPALLRRDPEALGVISDPLALCWDEDVSPGEAARVVRRIAAAVAEMRARGCRLVITAPDPPASFRDRAGLIDILRSPATRRIFLRPSEGAALHAGSAILLDFPH